MRPFITATATESLWLGERGGVSGWSDEVTVIVVVNLRTVGVWIIGGYDRGGDTGGRGGSM